MHTKNEVDELDLMRQQRLISENWYYTQIFPESEGFSVIHFITFADSTKDAMDKIHKHLTEIGVVADDSKINLYHKNYKREARTLVRIGSIIG